MPSNRARSRPREGASTAAVPFFRRVRSLFALSDDELAELFGVTQEDVEQWIRAGTIPASQRESPTSLLRVGEVLEPKLRRGMLPAVARRRAAA